MRPSGRRSSHGGPKLAELIDHAGPLGLTLHRSHGLFPSLLGSIISQQLNGKAAARIHQRVLALTGKPPTPAAIEGLADAPLRAAGLSANKLRAVRDLAAKTRAGVVPDMRTARKLTDDELIERLTTVRGIGPWTVHMLLMFKLGRPDVMPTGDFAIGQAFSRHFRHGRKVTPPQLLQHAEKWRPWRSVASWYLWRSLDTDPETEAATAPPRKHRQKSR